MDSRTDQGENYHEPRLHMACFCRCSADPENDRHDSSAALTVKALIWFVLPLVLSACAHDMDLMKLEEQVGGYGAAIRWNLFKKAINYLDSPPEHAPDWKTLADIKVTSYNVQFREVMPSGKVMIQTVEIRYLPAGGVVEKMVIDQQRWHLDEDSGRWLLETGLPPIL